MTTYYKVLNLDMQSFYDGKTAWRLGEWMPRLAGAVGDSCGVGYHLGTTPSNCFVSARFPVLLFEAEYRGDVLGQDAEKIRVSEARVVRVICPVWLRRVNAFVQSLTSVKFFDGHGKVNAKWLMFPARDAAYDAARDAARDAAWYAARDAAWYAARDDARDDAYDAARYAARDAAYDAAGLSLCLLVSDLKAFDKKHLRYMLRRWAVWEAGYGLAADVDGVFYVYRKP